MKKAFLLSGIALMMLFSLSAWAADPDDRLDNTLLAVEEPPPNPFQPGDYWLGIQCRYVPPAGQPQLQLPENQGIIVEGVMPDSPAAKAGLAKSDVILKADDKKLSDLSDLLQAIGAAKDKEMKLEIIRDGQPKTIAVTPAKRPEIIEQLQKSLQQLQIHPGPMQFRFFSRPGVILPPGAPIHPPLPENMSIMISKTGDKPADIVVKMGDEKWEVTEKDLNKLPEKVRPHVDRMLGMATDMDDGAMHWVPEMVPRNFQPPGPDGPGGPGPGGPGPGPGFHAEQGPNMNGPPGNILERRIEKRLEEMNQRIEKLRKELHERNQGDKTPENPQANEKKVEIKLETTN